MSIMEFKRISLRIALLFDEYKIRHAHIKRPAYRKAISRSLRFIIPSTSVPLDR